MVIPSSSFWYGKRVLVTGHTGFKGSWLTLWLNKMGARVTGISLLPDSIPNLFSLANISKLCESHFLDIRDSASIEKVVQQTEPEIVLHLAAQALVRPGYIDPLNTFSTNVMGTAQVLNALRTTNSIKVVVAVTTDKVYENFDNADRYREDDLLGGRDPYSASKAASEIIISCYREAYLKELGVAVASARAGNVIGGGDWSVDRLIPDAIRSWNAGIPLEIRRPDAIRPWQHVLEPLNGYLVLAERLYDEPSLAGAFNFGPSPNEVASVRRVIELASDFYKSGVVRWGDGVSGPHEATSLCLDISKAKAVLGVSPRWGLKESVERTMNWYQRQKKGESSNILCDDEISSFTNI